MSSMQRILLLILWTILICAVVAGSLLPAASPPVVAKDRLHINEELIHFLAYMALAFLPAVLLRPRRLGRSAAAAMFLLSLLLEMAQTAVPGREFELSDLLANAAGIVAGLLAAQAFQKRPSREVVSLAKPSKEPAA